MSNEECQSAPTPRDDNDAWRLVPDTCNCGSIVGWFMASPKSVANAEPNRPEDYNNQNFAEAFLYVFGMLGAEGEVTFSRLHDGTEEMDSDLRRALSLRDRTSVKMLLSITIADSVSCGFIHVTHTGGETDGKKQECTLTLTNSGRKFYKAKVKRFFGKPH